MEWAEIKRRLVKEGTSVQVLADLEAVPYKTMYNRIMAHQVKDGVTYLTPENTKGMKKAKAISETKQKQAKEKEKAAGLPENFNCANCANGVELPKEYGSTKYCAKGHTHEGIFGVCSEYVTAALEPFINAPEESLELPEDVPKLPEDIDNETISTVLVDINRSHADAVKTLHDCEGMLEQARESERQLRTLLIAMEQLAKGRKLPEVQ